MAYSGYIKFITETKTEAIVEETAAGAANPDALKIVNADFSSKVVGDTVSYVYNTYSNFNDGRNVTIS